MHELNSCSGGCVSRKFLSRHGRFRPTPDLTSQRAVRQNHQWNTWETLLALEFNCPTMHFKN